MAKNKKTSITIIVVVLAIVCVFGVKAIVEYSRGSVVRSSNIARTKGEKSAKVHVTEYIDFQCPACAAGALYLKKFMEDNPGTVRVQMKYFPLSMHKHAFLAAQYTECSARQGKFWPVHDLIVKRQRNWSILSSARPAFDVIIKEVGVDQEQLKECLNDPVINDIIMADKQEGSKLGVRSTPSYVVNDKFTVGLKALKQEIAKQINAE